MAVRSTMLALIARVRILINDPSCVSQTFSDQDVQNVLDEGRVDVYNAVLRSDPTFTSGTIQYLDFSSDEGGWEDGFVLKQYLTVPVTPSTSEPIAGHFGFAVNTYPPVFITGHLFDTYRAAADLLERMSALWVLRFSATVNGQNIQRGTVTTALQALAKTYRQKQRPGHITAIRSDLVASNNTIGTPSLKATPLDYFSSGNG